MLLTAIAVSCEYKPPQETSDIEGSKKAVAELLDKYHNGVRGKKAADITNLLAEDGLYCGTDPGELWNKKSFSDNMAAAFANTSMSTISYTIDKREIHLEKNAGSAIVLEQFTMVEFFGRKTPLRLVSHVVKNNGAWKIDFLSVSIVPHNEDIPKIGKALDSNK